MNLPTALTHADLLAAIEVQSASIVSRPLHDDAQSKVILFAFDSGQELSEHTAAIPAIMHFLSGEAEVLLGTEWTTAATGTWIRMDPRLPHAIRAKTPVIMLLTLLKQ